MAVTEMISDYLLLQPGWLWLIPPVLIFMLFSPLLRKLGWLKRQNQAIPAISVRHPQAMDYQHKSSASNNGGYFLTGICSCLMLLALAQPVHLGTRIDTTATSADILLIIDTSISMVMKDYQLDGQRVNRMTMTQALLDRFSRRFTGKRIGIVVLGEQPQILLSPSEDKALVRYMIHQLKPTISGRQAALGDAVAVAAEYIKSDKVNNETVMVLISSADAPSGKLSPVAGVERAIDAGAILHTIAIGSTESHASRPGELIYEPVDLKLLQQMAQMTGGESFHAVDVATMDAALRSIEQRHQILPDNTSNNKAAPRLHQPLYHWPLLAALLLLIMRPLRQNRNSKQASQGRPTA